MKGFTLSQETGNIKLKGRGEPNELPYSESLKLRAFPSAYAKYMENY